METDEGIPRRARSRTFGMVVIGSMLAVSSSSFRAAAASDVRLVEAVKKQDKEAVRVLLTTVDVNATAEDGATALHWATYHDDLETVDRLIRAGANAGATNRYGVTPLTLACTTANASMVERLLAAGADANAVLKSGETVLMTCARTGNVHAVKAILARGAWVEAKEASEHQTALMWAAAHGHSEVAQVLLDEDADAYARSRVKREVISRRLQSELKYGERLRTLGTDAEETLVGGFTPLLFAARNGHIETARVLLAAGADVNDTAPDGASVLVVAAHSGHGPLARFLLDHGADPHAAMVGYTALHAAVLADDLDTVKALLAHGARPNAQITLATRISRNGQTLDLGEHLLGATPIALAAKFAEVQMMRVLLAAGADPLLPLKNGWTPLMLAAGAGWRQGDWDRRDRGLDRFLATQLEWNDERGTLEAVKVAVEAGADLNAVDARGSTALHYIVDKGFPAVVQFLVEKGADPKLKNKSGLTPLATVSGRGRGGDPAVPISPKRQATIDLLRRLGGQ